MANTHPQRKVNNMSGTKKKLTQGQRAQRLFKTLRALRWREGRGSETLAELAFLSGLSGAAIRAVVKSHGDAIARRLGGAGLEYLGAETCNSGSGPWGRYSNARAEYCPATLSLR